jgi:EpsI family protein
MSSFSKRYLIIVILLLVTAFITFGAYSTKSYSGVLHTQNIPVRIGNWYGRDIPMDERTYDILETRDAFIREYTGSAGEKATLTVVFARNNRRVAHPPEVCLAGGGWSRTDRDIHSIVVGSRTLGFNRIILQKGSEKQIVLYLYKAGSRLTPNYYSQQLNIIMNGMLRKDTSSALIRLSCYVDGDSVEEPLSMLNKFAGEVIPVLEQHLP